MEVESVLVILFIGCISRVGIITLSAPLASEGQSIIFKCGYEFNDIEAISQLWHSMKNSNMFLCWCHQIIESPMSHVLCLQVHDRDSISKNAEQCSRARMHKSEPLRWDCLGTSTPRLNDANADEYKKLLNTFIYLFNYVIHVYGHYARLFTA